MTLFGPGPVSQYASGAEAIPSVYTDLANRVFSRTAPNGAIEVKRLLPGNTFEPTGGYPTNRVDFTREGLPANQAVLVFASTARFGNTYSWSTNRYLLTFETPLAGTYALDVTLNTVPGVQHFEGPFSFSTGNNIPPRITTQPSGGAFVLGQNISALSVGVVGFDLTYQWFRNGTAVNGATQSSFAFRPMSQDTLGQWHVVVSNPLGSVTSETVTIEAAVLPTISQDPQPAQALEGGTVAFGVVAAGGGLNYQWLFNGRAAGYPNSPTIFVTNVALAQAGAWSVEVFNNAGRVTSRAARLGICSPGFNHTYRDRPWVRILASGEPVPGAPNTFGPLTSPFAPLYTLRDQTVNLVARGDDDVAGRDVIHRGLFQWREGVLRTLVFTNTPKPLGGTFEDVFYPTEDGDGAINFAAGSMYEIRGTVIREILGPSTPVPDRADTFYGPGSFARRGSRAIISSTFGNSANPLPSGTGIYLSDGVRLTRICDSTTDLPGVLAGYAGRATEDSVNLDESTLVFSTITGINGAGGVYKSTFDGVITKLVDSGDGYQGFGDVDVEGGMIFAIVGTKVGASLANRVLAFPADGASAPTTIGAGDFLVAAGARDVYFGGANSIQRWHDDAVETVITTASLLDCKRIKRFVDVEAQGDDLAIAVEFLDGTAGVYAHFGRPTPGAPRILGQPQDTTIPETAPAVFAVAASGPEPLQYQWRKNGVPMAGETRATLRLLGTGASDLAEYDVVVTAGGSAVTSRAATLRLLAAPASPVIYAHPQTVIGPAGTLATLEVVASGAAPLAYQWRLGTNAIPGANQRTYRVTPATNSSYNVVIANAGGSVTSFVAAVQVQPILVREPESVTVAVGGTATFSVEAAGFAAYRYIWFKNGDPISGQTNAVLRLPDVQLTDAGSYSATVLGIGGAGVRSKSALLTVGGGTTAGIRLGDPSLVAGKVTFRVPTAAGKTYEVQFQSVLGGGAWTTVQTVGGDGAGQVVSVPPEGGAGFVRVLEKP